MFLWWSVSIVGVKNILKMALRMAFSAINVKAASAILQRKPLQGTPWKCVFAPSKCILRGLDFAPSDAFWTWVTSLFLTGFTHLPKISPKRTRFGWLKICAAFLWFKSMNFGITLKKNGRNYGFGWLFAPEQDALLPFFVENATNNPPKPSGKP